MFVYMTSEEELWEYSLCKYIYSFKTLDQEYIHTK